MGALPKEDTVFTYADYAGWELAQGERYELIYGEAFAMAAPNARHQGMLMALSSQFYNYLRGKPCAAFPAPFDVRLFYEEDDSDDTVVQPDISVICDEKKLGDEGCRGAPDLVVEILSPSNTAIEMGRKFKVYRQAGVREYWIIDPENKNLTVYHFQEKTVTTDTYGTSDTVSVALFPGLTIPLETVFTNSKGIVLSGA
jgi:Uma2 family endonuclease